MKKLRGVILLALIIGPFGTSPFVAVAQVSTKPPTLCPTGYTCTPIPPQPSNFPQGYICVLAPVYGPGANPPITPSPKNTNCLASGVCFDSRVSLLIDGVNGNFIGTDGSYKDTDIINYYSQHVAKEADFLIMFKDFDAPSYIPASDYSIPVNGNDTGMGMTPHSNNTTNFNSKGYLKSFMVMPNITEFSQTSAFNSSVYAFAHEIGHHWLAFFTNPSLHISASSGVHYDPCMIFDNAGFADLMMDSPFIWKQTSDTTFTSPPPDNNPYNKKFSTLSLYVMGLLPATSVSSQKIIRNASSTCSIDFNSYDGSNGFDGSLFHMAGAHADTIPLSDLIRVYGVRNPQFNVTQKNFTIQVILLVHKNSALTQNDANIFSKYLDAVETYLPFAFSQKANFTTIKNNTFTATSTVNPIPIPIPTPIPIPLPVTPAPSPSSNVAPSIISISPTSGPAGTVVTIIGNNFGSSNSVTLNGIIPTSSSGSNQLTFVVPKNIPVGSYGISVTNNANNYGSNTLIFTVTPSGTSMNANQSLTASIWDAIKQFFSRHFLDHTPTNNGNNAETIPSKSVAVINQPTPQEIATSSLASAIKIYSISQTSGPVGTRLTLKGNFSEDNYGGPEYATQVIVKKSTGEKAVVEIMPSNDSVTFALQSEMCAVNMGGRGGPCSSPVNITSGTYSIYYENTYLNLVSNSVTFTVTSPASYDQSNPNMAGGLCPTGQAWNGSACSASSQSPIITSISPNSVTTNLLGSANTFTITGKGFTHQWSPDYAGMGWIYRTDDVVIFQNSQGQKIDVFSIGRGLSPSDNQMTFTLPTGGCDYSRMDASCYQLPLNPGQYLVSVWTPSGTSNAVKFTISAGGNANMGGGLY